MSANDNGSGNIISFKPKKLKIDTEVIASVFVKDSLIGLSIKDRLIFLTPEAALELCLVLAAAIQAASEKGTP